jgi:hypothetical protein
LWWATVNLWTSSVSWSLSYVTCSKRCWTTFLLAVTCTSSALSLSSSVGSGRGSRRANGWWWALPPVDLRAVVLCGLSIAKRV